MGCPLVEGGLFGSVLPIHPHFVSLIFQLFESGLILLFENPFVASLLFFHHQLLDEKLEGTLVVVELLNSDFEFLPGLEIIGASREEERSVFLKLEQFTFGIHARQVLVQEVVFCPTLFELTIFKYSLQAKRKITHILFIGRLRKFFRFLN